MLVVFTSRIDYSGIDRLDITRKSGCAVGLVFAPSWEILGPALAARRGGRESAETWAEYEHAYLAELRTSYRRNREVWAELLGRESVTLCCYLQLVVDRCHRLILAEVLRKLGAEYKGERA